MTAAKSAAHRRARIVDEFRDERLPRVAIGGLDEIADVDADNVLRPVTQDGGSCWIRPIDRALSIHQDDCVDTEIDKLAETFGGRRFAHQSAAFISAIATSTLPMSSS